MKKQLLSLAAIIFLGAGGIRAQSDTVINKKDVTIERRMNNGKPEKTTIVIDGDKVTVNGEEVHELKGKLNMFGNGSFDFNSMKDFEPQMRDMFKSFGPQMQKLRGINMNTSSNKAMLGVNVDKAENGAKVTDVIKESGAEKAGLKKDDIITFIDAEKIADGDALIKTIGKYKPEDIVHVKVLRNGKEKKFEVTLGKNTSTFDNVFNWNHNDNSDFFGAGPRSFNFNGNNLRELNSLNERPKFGFGIKDNEDGDGAIVTDVKEETSASRAGLKENDIVTEVAGETVKTTDDLKRLLSDNRSKSEIEVKVLRSGKTKELTLKVPKKIKTAEL